MKLYTCPKCQQLVGAPHGHLACHRQGAARCTGSYSLIPKEAAPVAEPKRKPSRASAFKAYMDDLPKRYEETARQRDELEHNLRHQCKLNGQASMQIEELETQRDELLAACKDWISYAEENLSEFDDVEECDAEPLCQRCENSGCITLKIQLARAAIARCQPAEKVQP